MHSPGKVDSMSVRFENTNRPSRWQTPARRVLACCLIAALAGCSLAPAYQRPTIAVPANYKEGTGLWTRAEPADTVARGDWWQIFNDAALDKLEQRLDAGNRIRLGLQLCQLVLQHVAAEDQHALLGLQRLLVGHPAACEIGEQVDDADGQDGQKQEGGDHLERQGLKSLVHEE